MHELREPVGCRWPPGADVLRQIRVDANVRALVGELDKDAP